MSKNLNVIIQQPFDESFLLFDNLQTGEDVAKLLEIPLDSLIYILYKTSKSYYKTFEINKKTGGKRIIEKPIGSIDILQKKILPFLEAKYKIKKAVHGFVKDRSVLSNAQQHLKKKYILNIDLRDFFGSINFGRIRGLLMGSPFNMGDKAASIIAQICCNNNHLPQGACTSPILSNFIAAQLDNKLTQYAQQTHCTYTRYADDITFSSTKEFSKKIIIYDRDKNPILDGFILSDAFKDIIESSGFQINYQKVRLETKRIRQEVTGITVNNFPNVKRTFVRQVRAMLHSWEHDGQIKAEEKYFKFKKLTSHKNDGKHFKNVLIGKLAYLKMVRGDNDIILQKLCLKLIEVCHDNLPKFIKDIKMSSEKFDVFICHASEDKDTVARPLFDELQKIGVKAFLDEKYITWGDSLTEKINHALGQSRYVIAILSNSSIDKDWPLKEINATLAREISGDKVLLPIIVGDDDVSIFDKLPLLQDKLYKTWNSNAEQLANEIQKLLK